MPSATAALAALAALAVLPVTWALAAPVIPVIPVAPAPAPSPEFVVTTLIGRGVPRKTSVAVTPERDTAFRAAQTFFADDSSAWPAYRSGNLSRHQEIDLVAQFLVDLAVTLVDEFQIFATNDRSKGRFVCANNILETVSWSALSNDWCYTRNPPCRDDARILVTLLELARELPARLARCECGCVRGGTLHVEMTVRGPAGTEFEEPTPLSFECPPLPRP